MSPRKPRLSDAFPGVSPNAGKSPSGRISARNQKAIVDRLEDPDDEDGKFKHRPTAPKPEIRPNCFTYKDTIFRGQPHKKLILTQDGYDLVEEMKANAQPDRLIAYALGISWENYTNVRYNDPLFEEAYELGKGRLEGRCNELIMKNADSGNVIAQIFGVKLLTNRNPDKDHAPAQQVTNNVIVNIPGALSVDQYAEAMAKARRIAPAAAPVIETQGTAQESTTPALPQGDSYADQMPDWLKNSQAVEPAVAATASKTDQADDIQWEPLPEMPSAQRKDSVR